jgi:hypothetical protein
MAAPTPTNAFFQVFMMVTVYDRPEEPAGHQQTALDCQAFPFAD